MKSRISEIAIVNELSIDRDYPYEIINYLDIASVDKGQILEVTELNLKDTPSRAKRIVRSNDILISTVRPNLKHFCFIKNQPPNTIASTGFAVITVKQADPYYVYCLLTTSQYTEYLSAIADSHTSAYPAFNPDVIENSIFEFPPIEQQKAVTSILLNLENKIELNRKMNETLEAIAKAIFRSWFVDFDPVHAKAACKKPVGMDDATAALFPDSFEDSELGRIPLGWEVLTIADVCNFQNGYAFKSKELSDLDIDSYRVFKMGNIEKGGGFKRNGSNSYILKQKCHDIIRYLLKKSDLLMCMTDMKSSMALLGHTALMDVDDEYIVNQRVGRITAKDKSTVNYPYLYVLSNSPEFIQSLRSRANSGVQVNLSTAEILSTKILLPNKEIHGKYNDIAENIFEKIFINNFETEILIKIRDMLLPKLISGEIKAM